MNYFFFPSSVALNSIIHRVINMKEFTFEGSDIHVTVPGDMFILNTDFSVRFVMVNRRENGKTTPNSPI